MMKHRLCYVKKHSFYGIMFFTDNFEGQDGEEWHKSYLDSGEPYVRGSYPHIKDNESGHIIKIAFCEGAEDIQSDVLDEWRGPRMSVNDVNKGRACWLYSDSVGPLKGGDLLVTALTWLEHVGAEFAILKRDYKHELIHIPQRSN